MLEKEHKQVRTSMLLFLRSHTGVTVTQRRHQCHRLKKPSAKPAQRRAKRRTTFKPSSRFCKKNWVLSSWTARQPPRCVTDLAANNQH